MQSRSVARVWFRMQAAQRFEGSLMTSLAELKSIEQQRVADERMAVMRDHEMRVQAKTDAERQAREALEANQRADYEARLAIERAKADAERELRLRVESAEAAERARQQMILEQERSQQEMELRRAEVAKKRPTWMVAVTGLALVLATVLVVFTVKALGASDDANEQRTQAEKIAKEKQEETAAMHRELEKIEANLKVLDGKVAAAIDQVVAASGKAAIDAAAVNLKKLRAEQADQAYRAEKYRIEKALAERLKGVHDVCAGQSVCKGTK